MSVVPKNQIDKVQFYENHLADFTANAVAMGSSVAEVSALQTKTEAARAAYDAQQVAKQAAKVARQMFEEACAAMAASGAAIIKQVRAKAESTGTLTPYNLSGLPVPATPSPAAAPGKPYQLTVEVGELGELYLKWKCANPSGGGVMYQLYRSDTGSDGEAKYIGGCGSRYFVDNTVPAGASSVTYQMQAVRSTKQGPWATFNVQFGVNASGATQTSVGETATVKIAA